MTRLLVQKRAAVNAAAVICFVALATACGRADNNAEPSPPEDARPSSPAVRPLRSETGTYEEAYSQPLGSTRSTPCESRLTMENGSALALVDDAGRRKLGGLGLPPYLVDGSSCIWRVGDLRGGDGRRYELYFHDVEWGAALHATYRLYFVDDDQRLAGVYGLDSTSFRIDGADVVFDHVVNDGDRIHIGPNGLPPRILINGRWSERGVTQ